MERGRLTQQTKESLSTRTSLVFWMVLVNQGNNLNLELRCCRFFDGLGTSKSATIHPSNTRSNRIRSAIDLALRRFSEREMCECEQKSVRRNTNDNYEIERQELAG